MCLLLLFHSFLVPQNNVQTIDQCFLIFVNLVQ